MGQLAERGDIIKYFLDTEFYERPGKIDLISIGIVSEDGRHYYAQNPDAPYGEINKEPWLSQNVLPHLYDIQPLLQRAELVGSYWRNKGEMRKDILGFVGSDSSPMFVTYFGAYDWVVFCWIFGRMVDLPKGWPMFPLDLKQVMFMKSGTLKEKAPIPKPEGEHNALVDAAWNKELWGFLGKPGAK